MTDDPLERLEEHHEAAEAARRAGARRLSLAGVVVLLVGLLLAANALASRSCSGWSPFDVWGVDGVPNPVPFSPEERHLAALFGVDDLARDAALPSANGATYVYAQDEPGGFYLKRREGDMGEPGVAVGCYLDVSAREEDARHWFELQRKTQGFAEGRTSLPPFTFEPLELAWGDERAAAVLLEEGTPVGNALLARSGERVILVEWRGRVVRDPDELLRVVGPSLEALASLAR